jgi:hypothetical protein
MGVKLGTKWARVEALLFISFVLHGIMEFFLNNYRGWKIKSKLMVNVTSLGVGFVFFKLGGLWWNGMG